MAPLLVDDCGVLHLELPLVGVAMLFIPLRWPLLVPILRVVLLIHLRLLVLELYVPVVVRLIVALLSFWLLLPYLMPLLIFGRRWHVDFNRHVLGMHVGRVSPVLLDLVSNLRGDVLQVGWKWATVRVLVLL